MKEELVKNIKEILEAVKETEIDVDGNIILDKAINIYLVKANEQRQQQPQPPKKLASEKQIFFLRSLGYKGKSDITSLEASQLIKEMKEKQNNENYTYGEENANDY